MTLNYDANEPSFIWTGRAPVSCGMFEIRPPQLALDATPIFDHDLDCIIGYQQVRGGVFRIYDLAGDLVSLAENPLESSLFDPLDALLIVGSLWKAGVRTYVGRLGTKAVGAAIGPLALMGLRSRFQALARQEMRFSAKPLQHMMNPDRFVPLHILRLAIRHGRRSRDPAGHAGLFLYTSAMKRNGRTYKLEVLVRESDYTVLHFLFEH